MLLHSRKQIDKDTLGGGNKIKYKNKIPKGQCIDFKFINASTSENELGFLQS